MITVVRRLILIIVFVLFIFISAAMIPLGLLITLVYYLFKGNIESHPMLILYRKSIYLMEIIDQD